MQVHAKCIKRQKTKTHEQSFKYKPRTIEPTYNKWGDVYLKIAG